MGSDSPSSQLLKQKEELLTELVSETPKSADDSFWQELLSFSVPLTKVSPQDLEALAWPYCEKLVMNNGKTFNLQVLLQHLLLKLQDTTTPEAVRRATDAVVFVRVLLMYLVERFNADDLVAFLDSPLRAAKSNNNAALPTGESWVNQLVGAMLHVLIVTPLNDATYLLHLECLNFMLVSFSTQLYTTGAQEEAGRHPFTEVIMDLPQMARQLLAIFLHHYVERRPLPKNAPVYIPPPAEKQGILRMVRNAAASVLWLPIQALTFLIRSGERGLGSSPLSETALLVLLVLVHHAPPTGHDNPFRKALQTLQDSGDEDESGGEVDAEAPSTSGRDGVSFARLYKALGGSGNEKAVLLLYDLLHTSPHFKNYVMLQEELDTIVLPLAHSLYAASEPSPSQMYMLLIVILILSQDPSFSQNIHKLKLDSVPWYKERLLKDSTLGSFLVVMLIRTTSYNLSKLQDVYLHTNTLAALSNLGPHMSGLSSYASQRLLALLDFLIRRYVRSNESGEAGPPEMQVFGDFLRILLEVLNCIIVKQLRQNPELVYALLHRQEILDNFKDLQQFSELLDNINLVAAHFNGRIDQAKKERQQDWSVKEVLAVIEDELKHWPGELNLRRFPDLKFTYEEETSPEGFFVPYVWTLVVTGTAIPWRPHTFALFSPFPNTDDADSATLDGLESDMQLAEFAKDNALSAAYNSV